MSLSSPGRRPTLVLCGLCAISVLSSMTDASAHFFPSALRVERASGVTSGMSMPMQMPVIGYWASQPTHFLLHPHHSMHYVSGTAKEVPWAFPPVLKTLPSPDVKYSSPDSTTRKWLITFPEKKNALSPIAQKSESQPPVVEVNASENASRTKNSEIETTIIPSLAGDERNATPPTYFTLFTVTVKRHLQRHLKSRQPNSFNEVALEASTEESLDSLPAATQVEEEQVEKEYGREDASDSPPSPKPQSIEASAASESDESGDGQSDEKSESESAEDVSCADLESPSESRHKEGDMEELEGQEESSHIPPIPAADSQLPANAIHTLGKINTDGVEETTTGKIDLASSQLPVTHDGSSPEEKSEEETPPSPIVNTTPPPPIPLRRSMPQRDPPRQLQPVTSMWLRDVVLNALARSPTFQQVLAIDVGTLVINLGGNASEWASLWKALAPTTSIQQKQKKEKSPKDKESGIMRKGQSPSETKTTPMPLPPPTETGETDEEESDSPPPRIKMPIDPRSIRVSPPMGFDIRTSLT